MRAGRLGTLMEVLECVTIGVVTLRDSLWCELREADAGHQASLRVSQPSTLLARPGVGVVAGQFLRSNGRLWVVDGVTTERKQTRIAATELLGPLSVYAPSIGSAYEMFAFHSQNTEFVAEDGSSVYRRTIDVARPELRARPMAGDVVTVHGVAYTVTGIAEGGDDGAVLRLLVRK